MYYFTKLGLSSELYIKLGLNDDKLGVKKHQTIRKI